MTWDPLPRGPGGGEAAAVHSWPLSSSWRNNDEYSGSSHGPSSALSPGLNNLHKGCHLKFVMLSLTPTPLKFPQALSPPPAPRDSQRCGLHSYKAVELLLYLTQGPDSHTREQPPHLERTAVGSLNTEKFLLGNILLPALQLTVCFLPVAYRYLVLLKWLCQQPQSDHKNIFWFPSSLEGGWTKSATISC